MANAFRLSIAAVQAAMGDAATQGVKGYASTGSLFKFYVGAPGANVSTAPGGALLGTLTMAGAYTAATTGGVLAATTISSDTSADTSGTCGSFWHCLANGTSAIADGTVGQTSGYDINFDNNVFVATGTIAMSSFSMTLAPNSA